MQEMTPQIQSQFSGSVVPAKFALNLCYLWSCLGDSLVWSEANHWVYWFWRLLGGDPV